jgi:hypothetical protein
VAPASDGVRGLGTKSPDQIWSGRRGSNPRPTAWKAVTLPLSYSRLRGSLPHAASPLRRASPPMLLSIADGPPSHCAVRRTTFADSARWLANRSSRSERRLVAREGLEPSKPLGRQIYSLLRLTASLPRRCPCVIVQRSPSVRPPRTGRHGCSVRPQPNATSESSNCIC